MRAVGIRVLKNKLSEYVRLAQAGETVLVTDRDRVVAELHPPEPGRAVSPVDAMLADAIRQGLVTAPGLPGIGVPPSRPTMKLAQVLAGLDGDREER
jgi:antitoxin (DNA-binding transcriptional repressor) of toxin-antitoxin stability system